ncbi:putative nuclease HARBI1 [Melanaphis sacchari]|uniref:putative nuclease HARBI1 n=1 Tax=Melanaphis sacchari TaxID=742174 RepID=UPI000DC1420A|nr:putative nuclease HARBI1 [Melanaphis sacchari]
MNSDNSSSSDEEINSPAIMRGPYSLFRLRDHFSFWTDDDFLDRFRLSKTSVRFIVIELGDRIIGWNNDLSPEHQVILTLQYYATGSMLIACREFRGISKLTACRVVKIVSHSIAALRSDFIEYPYREQDIRMLKLNFFTIANFPMVIGALDCTHVKIKFPGGNYAEAYRNKNNFFSINVQIICDSRLKILDIDAKWPGSSHDSAIFDNSAIRRKLDNFHIENCVLIAKSGYTQHKYIMTLVANPQTAIDSESGINENIIARYNESLSKTRNTVKNCCNIWKIRFPILATGINVKITSPQSIIVATAPIGSTATILCDIGVIKGDEEFVTRVTFAGEQPIVTLSPQISGVVIMADRSSCRRLVTEQIYIK